jgi:hypothetical protein
VNNFVLVSVSRHQGEDNATNPERIRLSVQRRKTNLTRQDGFFFFTNGTEILQECFCFTSSYFSNYISVIIVLYFIVFYIYSGL